MDAECTHDGSIKHVQKFEHWGWETLQRRVLDAERSDSLTVLQVSDLISLKCTCQLCYFAYVGGNNNYISIQWSFLHFLIDCVRLNNSVYILCNKLEAKANTLSKSTEEDRSLKVLRPIDILIC